MRRATDHDPRATAYERACVRLCALGRSIGLERRAVPTGHRLPSATRKALEEHLALLGSDLSVESVLLASGTLFAMLSVGGAAVLAFALVLSLGGLVLPAVIGFLVLPLLAREMMISYIHGLARKRATALLRGSPESVNLMIMSLRHEPSLSKAIMFASSKDGPFARELRGAVWSVVMGARTSFEDALHALGQRWREYCAELKDSLSAMITASLEGTEEGKRRALDRANAAMVSGTKRRIEEYALSLSSPSMLLFGLGILLPLMVGSFLPMLSWNLWSLEPQAPGAPTGGQSLTETVFLMNVLFPAIATVVVLNAVSRHPLGPRAKDTLARKGWASTVGMAVASVALALVADLIFEGETKAPATLLAGSVPFSAWLVAFGRGEEASHSEDVEDALFRIGSKMVDGENFESALNDAANDPSSGRSKTIQRLAFRTNALGQDFDSVTREEADAAGTANAIEALRVVREAASKDEQAAGTLAMDLAVYLRDLRELDRTLKNRLKPTISMMRMTVFALGPVVLGVTYAIFLTLSSMIGDGLGGLQAEPFLLVLGVFLAETDAVVCSFIWGIWGAGTLRALVRSIGTCMLVSELVFVATACVAA